MGGWASGAGGRASCLLPWFSFVFVFDCSFAGWSVGCLVGLFVCSCVVLVIFSSAMSIHVMSCAAVMYVNMCVCVCACVRACVRGFCLSGLCFPAIYVHVFLYTYVCR